MTPDFGPAELQALYERMGVLPHAVLGLPNADQVRTLLARDGGRDELAEMLQRRQERVKLSLADPLEYGFEQATWADADAMLKTYEVLGIFGGNRAGKTWYAVKRAIQTVVTFPSSRVAVLSEGETPSITTVQAMAWYYLQGRYSHLNRKQDVVFKVNYSQANGFSDKKLVLPNGSEMYFLTYGQEVGDYEGWEFGAPAGFYEQIRARLEAEGKFCPPNVGAVADESMPLKWLSMLARRIKFRKAKLLWSFTPVKGITPAVKELVGASAETIESRPSELLPRRNFPDLPEGHMPYRRKCVFPRAGAIYFFSHMTPYGASPGRTYYDEIKELCAGKTSEYVERVAYGVARDSVARAFPKFGPWNVVKRTQLPAIGTNYFFCDPAGARNWFMLWVRVTPGNPGSHYIYRDWPDLAAYGEWAVPTEREVNEEARKGWDGDPGPAQPGMGYGVVRYKQQILECERIKPDSMDPQHVRLRDQARRSGADLKQVRETIAERYIDSRAAANEHIAEEGGTCILEEFAEVQKDSQGQVTGAGMDLTPASGVGKRQGSDENEGLTLVNEMLDWNQEQKLVAVLNQPHLYVCEDAAQVRWMFENFTGRAGEKGASKDPADLARYMALAKLEYVPDGGRPCKPGRGF